MRTGKSLCALPVEQNETGQRLNLTLMYKAINYKDVDNWRTSACDCNILGTTSHNLLFSRMLGRHYQETKGHPRSWVVVTNFVVDYNPNGRYPSENSIKDKIIKQIGGGGLRYGSVSMTNSIGKDAPTENMRIINSSKSLSFHWVKLSPCPLSNKVFLIFSVEILGRPKEIPEEKHLVVTARVKLIPSGEGAGDQVIKLLSRASESEWKPKSMFGMLWKTLYWRWKVHPEYVTEGKRKHCSVCPRTFLCDAKCLHMCCTFARPKVCVLKTFPCPCDWTITEAGPGS